MYTYFVSQKNLKPPVPYKGSSFLSVSDSIYEWFPYGTNRYLKQELIINKQKPL